MANPDFGGISFPGKTATVSSCGNGLVNQTVQHLKDVYL